MQCRQDWRLLLAPLEAYIEASGDTSPISYLANKYHATDGRLSAAVAAQLDALLGQAHELVRQTQPVSGVPIAAVSALGGVEVDCAPDGSWLKVGERELRRLRNKQCDFVLTMVEAYQKGNRRPKVEWAFRVAGYGEGTYDLRHITRRKEFFDFFAQGGGECWIVSDPDCASSLIRKV